MNNSYQLGAGRQRAAYVGLLCACRQEPPLLDLGAAPDFVHWDSFTL